MPWYSMAHNESEAAVSSIMSLLQLYTEDGVPGAVLYELLESHYTGIAMAAPLLRMPSYSTVILSLKHCMTTSCLSFSLCSSQHACSINMRFSLFASAKIKLFNATHCTGSYSTANLASFPIDRST